MGRFLLRLFAAIGILSVLLVAGVAILLAVYLPRKPPPPERVVLALDLREAPHDVAPQDPLVRALTGGRPTLQQVVEAIDRARDDPRVIGLTGEFGGDAFGLATAQELREAVERFRRSGKFALAYAASFGELGPGNTAYYLAAGFDEIWMQPVGSLGLTGVRAELPFARGALDRIGVEPEIVRRGPFKTFPEVFTEHDITPANREMMEALTADLYHQLAAGIAAGRGLAGLAQVEALIDNGPFTAAEAAAAGLVNRLGDRPDFDDAVDQHGGEDAEPLDPLAYLDLPRPGTAEPAATVALIYATGTILPGDGRQRSPFGAVSAGANTIADAIEDAIDDDDINVIVLRIDSPGGSPSAAATIGRAVAHAAAEGKPLIVSMGGAAASGGYWIATHAAEIVAEPATLTGSIGVFGGKVNTERLFQDLGITWDGVQQGRNADIWSWTRPYSASGLERLNALIDDTYARFLDRVAEGRQLPREAVEAVAGGRVWTGDQARERGLVDRLGGLTEALAAARARAGVPPDAPIDVELRPQPESPFAFLAQIFRNTDAQGTALAAALRPLAPALRQIEPLLADPAARLLRMPPLRVIGG